jgi:hypothetical protein
MDELQSLRLENKALKSRILELERELVFLKTHPTIAQGLKGETIIAKLTHGIATTYAEAHDLVVGQDIRIEVKFSKLNTPVKG